MPPRPISFLSDYGTADEFAGVCRAVIARIAPEATVIDLTHGIRRHAVAEGAAVLAAALSYVPPGVHLAVVDPGVGSPRRAVAARAVADGRLLVGPDNGLLAPALRALGGAEAAVDVSRSDVRLEPVSATFHGRDVFAPVAAHLANGRALEELGEPIDPGGLAPGEPTRARLEEGRVVAHALYVDRYGNVALDLGHEQLLETGLRLGRRLQVQTPAAELEAAYAHAFSDADAGGLILYEDAYRRLALAVNRGSAAELLNLAAGDEVVLRPT